MRVGNDGCLSIELEKDDVVEVGGDGGGTLFVARCGPVHEGTNGVSAPVSLCIFEILE